jgi:hypothetical protein
MMNLSKQAVLVAPADGSHQKAINSWILLFVFMGGFENIQTDIYQCTQPEIVN